MSTMTNPFLKKEAKQMVLGKTSALQEVPFGTIISKSVCGVCHSPHLGDIFWISNHLIVDDLGTK